MNRILLVASAMIFALGMAAAETLSPEDFLDRVRYPQTGRSMAAMNGIMQHLKNGGKMETVPIYLGILIEPEQTRAQLILNEDEGYWIHQAIRRNAEGGAAISVAPMRMRPETSRLRRYGLEPTDLTMGFVYYDFRKELDGARVKGLPCRVMVLASKGGEAVRAYILRDYYFPLKVEFFADEAAALAGGSPLRTMEVGSFRQKNKLYYAEIVDLRGPDWRSRVTFDRAELMVPQPGTLPPFRDMKKTETAPAK